MITLLFSVLALANITPREPVPSGLTLQKLILIRNDDDANQSTLSAMLNDQGILQGFYSMPGEKNEEITANDPNVFFLKDIEKQDGVTMIERRGYKALVLKGQLDRDLQGTITIRYLSNALLGSYKNCDIAVKQNTQGYFLENIYTKKPITEALIMMKTLGIKTIKGVCKD